MSDTSSLWPKDVTYVTKFVVRAYFSLMLMIPYSFLDWILVHRRDRLHNLFRPLGYLFPVKKLLVRKCDLHYSHLYIDFSREVQVSDIIRLCHIYKCRLMFKARYISFLSPYSPLYLGISKKICIFWYFQLYHYTIKRIKK